MDWRPSANPNQDDLCEWREWLSRLRSDRPNKLTPCWWSATDTNGSNQWVTDRCIDGRVSSRWSNELRADSRPTTDTARKNGEGANMARDNDTENWPNELDLRWWSAPNAKGRDQDWSNRRSSRCMAEDMNGLNSCPWERSLIASCAMHHLNRCCEWRCDRLECRLDELSFDWGPSPDSDTCDQDGTNWRVNS